LGYARKPTSSQTVLKNLVFGGCHCDIDLCLRRFAGGRWAISPAEGTPQLWPVWRSLWALVCSSRLAHCPLSRLSRSDV